LIVKVNNEYKNGTIIRLVELMYSVKG
jgi:hypothetical protein